MERFWSFFVKLQVFYLIQSWTWSFSCGFPIGTTIFAKLTKSGEQYRTVSRLFWIFLRWFSAKFESVCFLSCFRTSAKDFKFLLVFSKSLLRDFIISERSKPVGSRAIISAGSLKRSRSLRYYEKKIKEKIIFDYNLKKTLDFLPVLHYYCIPPNFVVEFWYSWLEEKPERLYSRDFLLHGQKSFSSKIVKNA